MKTRSFAIPGALLLLAAGAAFGQTTMSADIPFEFSMSNRTMPAGHYDVSQTQAAVLLSCYTSRASAFVAVNNLGTAPSASIGNHLVFHKYGDKYFLSEVWAELGSTHAAAVVMSKVEREAAKSKTDVSRVNVPMGKSTATVAAVR